MKKIKALDTDEVIRKADGLNMLSDDTFFIDDGHPQDRRVSAFFGQIRRIIFSPEDYALKKSEGHTKAHGYVVCGPRAGQGIEIWIRDEYFPEPFEFLHFSTVF